MLTSATQNGVAPIPFSHTEQGNVPLSEGFPNTKTTDHHSQAFTYHSFTPGLQLQKQTFLCFTCKDYVISVKHVFWAPCSKLSGQCFSDTNENQRTHYRALIYSTFTPNLPVNVLLILTTLSIPVHCLSNIQQPVANLHKTISLGALSKAFSKSTKAKYRCFFLLRNFFCICLRINIASVVPRPGIKPNCISSIFICLLICFSSILIHQLQASAITSNQSLILPYPFSSLQLY